MKSLWKRFKSLWNRFSDTIFDKFFSKRLLKAADKCEHECRYALQCTFIPELVSGIREGRLSVDDFLNIDVWKVSLDKIYGSDYLFKWEDFDYRKYSITEKHTAIIFLFPQPMMSPDAMYGAVIVNNETNAVAYYTLELTHQGDYMFVATTDENRFIFGTFKEASIESFLERIKQECQFV